MKNRIDKLIALLIAIKEFAKYIHYSAKGEAFYTKHLLMDKAVENIDDHIDELKEVCLLGNNILPLENYLTSAVALMPKKSKSDEENLKLLAQLIKQTVTHIGNIEANKAEDNLLGNIAQDLQKVYGLILRQVANGKESNRVDQD